MSEPTATDAELIGKVLDEYRIQALIGRGAMGAVYLAHDVGLNRNVAVKVLLGSLSRNEEAVKRFHREAQTASPLRHVNIVRIYSAGVEGGTPYIAMEYVEGEPLDRFLARQGRIPWQTALFIGQQVAEALDCAHGHGIIHRDVKPANILLDKHGQVRLTDFGIANVAAVEEDREEGRFLGTPHFMSPEQCAGVSIGPATDLYSLGVMLYLMISGRLPFRNESPIALMKTITNDEAPRLNRIMPEVPDDVARLIAHLMSKETEQRPPDARSVVRVIQRLHEERGGRSAMPEALVAFMKEQTRIRPVRTLLKPTDMPDSVPGGFLKNLPKRVVLARALAVLTLVIVFAFLPSLIVLGARQPDLPSQMPAPAGARFVDLAPHVRVARLDSPGFQTQGLEWIGEAHAVLMNIHGRPGTANHGAVGVLGVDVDESQFLSIKAPAGPIMDPFFWQIRAPFLGAAAPPPLGPESPLAQDAVFPELGSRLATGESSVQLTARQWNVSERGEVLLELSGVRWNPAAGSPWWMEHCGYAVPKPDGQTVCLVLQGANDPGNYLAEFDFAAPGESGVGPRLTSENRRIDPLSVHYSQSGDQLAYIRTEEDGERRLFVFSFDRDRIDGRPVQYEVAGPVSVFSPDGTLIAAMVGNSNDKKEIHIVSARNGMEVGYLGAGQLGMDAWHPNGSYIIATHEGVLWAIGVEPPHERIALSPSSLRLTGGASVSADGRWAAVVADDEEGPAAAFVRLNRLTFQGLQSPDS
jgi:predicted Ser/Thr protein kinase